MFLRKRVRPEGIWVKLTARPQSLSLSNAAQAAPRQASTEGFRDAPHYRKPWKPDFPSVPLSPFFLLGQQHPREGAERLRWDKNPAPWRGRQVKFLKVLQELQWGAGLTFATEPHDFAVFPKLLETFVQFRA